MTLRQCILFPFAFAVASSLSLQAADKEALKKKIESDLEQHHFSHLGSMLKSQINHKLDLKWLEAVARESGSESFLNAAEATRTIRLNGHNLAISRGSFFKTALFMEEELDKKTNGQSAYLPRHITGLSHPIEYDAENNGAFIILKNEGAFLGEGAHKMVHKAIEYDGKNSRVVARAERETTNTEEYEITKELHGKPGLFETVGFSKYKRKNKPYVTIYSKLYSPGSLQTAFDKKCRLSDYEKMKVALSIVTGLESLHVRGLVHRDLGARNYLINIPSGKPGKRDVQAAIADLERTMAAKDCAGLKVQGNTSYTAPEGLYLKKMKGDAYFRSDVFAVGCVFYRMFYEKEKCPWQYKSFVKDTKHTLNARYKALTYLIKQATKKKRTKLAQKSKLSPKQEFERLILKMVHVNPDKRGTATELKEKMEKIFAKAQ